jgi:hypothetical protein
VSQVAEKFTDVKLHGSVALDKTVVKLLVAAANRKGVQGLQVCQLFEVPVVHVMDDAEMAAEIEECALTETGCTICGTSGQNETHRTGKRHRNLLAIQMAMTHLMGFPKNEARPAIRGFTRTSGRLSFDDFADFWGNKHLIANGGFQRLTQERIRDAKHVLLLTSMSKAMERIPVEQITSITAAAI